ncbi:flagellar hook-associated protein FlgK [Antarcticirhabdus aurantiaca]|uniref:Flagellar hook-associated protein FlgK n=1 Tax=Antarcticirhabdus aurantiaca TaxID=2606717 RepID=A0ACD4NT72_9HYPH|nr:flagellar hook-associated protein FlgK [Antarcticirhabdus aurantiaca]WAJ29979.1 flagellar hook-associated protein FlgK [Jeongeuplla avenae]
MSLSSALNTAKSSLAATQTHTQLVSRNIANLNTAGATRKYANVVTGINGKVEIASIAQSQNSVLFRNMLDSTSSLAATKTVANGLSRISETIGDPELGRSPAALVSKLKDTIDAAAAQPNNFELARAAVQTAQDLATSLNQGAAMVQAVRQDADGELVAAAKSMNDILSRIKDLNDQVIAGTTGGTDVTDFVDKRDQAVAELSEYVGVSVGFRANNDMVLYTDSGVTLFERVPRLVEFSTSGALTSGSPGNVFKIDGVTVTGDNAFMPIKSGKIAGLVELRDKIAVTYGNQLDEMAGKLREAFQETGPTGLLTPVDGLFTGTVTAPPSTGLATTIKVSANAMADPKKLRDGVAGGTYDYNATGLAGFTGRLNALSTALSTSRSFTTLGSATNGSIAEFAASSVGWLEANRSKSLTDSEYKQTLLSRTQETLSDTTGINLAEEMTLLIDLERSYQASSKLISTVDEMLAALLQAI